ncbi:MAG: hypothetical protein MUC36_24030 [Planctomycetes bacterium]|jgi:hypothetical protein|nr:hypothetical protein [Planctomycetota bacterium]
MRKRLLLCVLSVFAACAASDVWEAETEPDQIDLTLPAQTPAQLVGFEFPPGLRPGNQLRLVNPRDASRQRRFAWVAPRLAPEQAPSAVYCIDAHGRDGRIGLLQVSLMDTRQEPVEAWAAAAGLRVTGQLGGIMLPPFRDRMTMSSDHMHVESLRDPGRLLTTDRDGLLLAVRSNGKVDGFLWVGDESLLGVVNAVSYRRVLEGAENALAGTDVQAMIAAKVALEKSGIQKAQGEPAARAAALVARVDDKVREHDAPLVAEIERIAVPAAQQVSGEDFVTAVVSVGRCAQQMGPVVRQLLGGYPQALHVPFRQLQQKANETVAAGGNSAVVMVATRVAKSMSMWQDDLLTQLGTAQAFDAAPTYAIARQRREELKQQLGTVAEQRDPLWRHGIAAACEREAAAFAGQGNPEANRYLRDLAQRVRGQAGAYAPEKHENEHDVAGFCRKLGDYCRLGDDTARLDWLLRESGSARIFRGSGVRQQDEFVYRSHVHLTDLLRPFVDREWAAAATARSQGLAATAALHMLRSIALFGSSSHCWENPIGIAAAGQGIATQEGSAARVVQDLLPLLRVVLPPISAATDECGRLVQLFREGECLDWPLVRQATFQFEPGDPQLPAWRGETAVRFAWLESRGDDQLVLTVHERPQPDAGLGFLARLSGLSEETVAEGKALRVEKEQLDLQQAEIDAERPAMDAAEADVKERGAAIDRDRATVRGATDNVVTAFNERVQAFNRDLAAAKQLQEGFNAKVRALNARVAAFNPRVNVYNERVMRERAVGGHRVDTMLRRALSQWLDVAFGDYEAQLRQRGVDEAALARELELAKWWFGRARPAMSPWLDFTPKALADMQRLAIERTVHVQPTSESLARLVVSHWYWSRECGKVQPQETFFREWAKTFRWQRDVKFLQDAIAADQRLGEVDRLTMARLLREVDQR